MNNAQLFSFAMSQVDDRYVEEALTYQAPARHRRRHTWLRYPAAVCLAALLGLSTVLVASAQVREAVYGWLKEQYETFIHYKFLPEEETDADASGAETASHRYTLSQLPEGYREIDRFYFTGLYQSIVYETDGGHLYFCAVIGTDTELFVKEQDYTVRQVEVAGVTGDLYIPDDPTGEPVLVWIKDSVLFNLSGTLTADELLYYTEFVEEEPPEPVWIPEGYVLNSEEYLPASSQFSYIGDEGDWFKLSCFFDPEDASIQQPFENHIHAAVTVRGMTADLYLSNDPEVDSSILWEEDGILYCISALLPEEKLIALAESVEGIGK